MPDSVLSVLCALVSFNHHNFFLKWVGYYPHVVDEEMETQLGKVRTLIQHFLTLSHVLRHKLCSLICCLAELCQNKSAFTLQDFPTNKAKSENQNFHSV